MLFPGTLPTPGLHRLSSAALARMPCLAFRSVETLSIQDDFQESDPEEDVCSSANTGSALDPPWHQPGTLLSTQMAGAQRGSFSALTSPQRDPGTRRYGPWLLLKLDLRAPRALGA